MQRFLFGVLCYFILAGLVRAQTLSPQVRAFVKVDAPSVALTHVRVIDGTGAGAHEDQTATMVPEPARESARGTVGSR